MISFKEFITLAESSWKNLLYHSTKDSGTSRRTGTHLGTLRAAVERGWDTGNHNDDHHVHAYDYKPSGKTLRVRDNWGAHPPEQYISHQLKNRGIISPEEHKHVVIGKGYAERLAKVLKSKGVSTLVYKNKAENRGKDSHIVYDPENLQHKHTFNDPHIIRDRLGDNDGREPKHKRNKSREKKFARFNEEALNEITQSQKKAERHLQRRMRKLNSVAARHSTMSGVDKSMKNWTKAGGSQSWPYPANISSRPNTSSESRADREWDRMMFGSKSELTTTKSAKAKLEKARLQSAEAKKKQLSFSLHSKSNPWSNMSSSNKFSQRTTGGMSHLYTSSAVRPSLDRKNILKNPKPEQFDNLFKRDDWCRVLKWKNNWYVWSWESSHGTVHDDVIQMLGIPSEYEYGESHAKRASIYAVQLRQIENDTLEMDTDSIDMSHWNRIKRNLSKDKAFCEFTKNWNIKDIHGKVEQKKHRNALTNKELRLRVRRNMALNLAENKRPLIIRALTKFDR